MHKSSIHKIPEQSMTNKFIILDLDETLVHSNVEDEDAETLKKGNVFKDGDIVKEANIFSDPELLDLRRRVYHITMDDVVHKKGEGNKAEMWGLLRPYAKEFLIFCFSYFKGVIVWSAGKKNYVHAIVDHLFKDINRPLIIYTFNELEKLNDGTFIKPIQKIISNTPGLSKYMSLENAFILDDRETVFMGPNPGNGIKIPAYKCNFNKLSSMRADDIALKQLMIWLSRPEVMNSKDVRELDKSNVFNTHIMTDS